MMKIAKLKNSIQEYAWGSYTAIPELLGEPSPAEKPQAELWMGAHHKAPSEVIMGNRKIALPELIKEDPAAILGIKTAEKYNGSLPFLFKVLAMAEPLSIQAHPNQAQAKKGFARENKQDIPIDGFNRNYRDTNHKPEILCALTTCWALKGFRPIEQIVSIMAPLNITGIAPLVEALDKNPNEQGLRRFFASLLTLDPESKRVSVAEVLAHIQHNRGDTEGAAEPCRRWIIKLNERYPGDIGVLSPLFLNLVEVKPGEALFLQAGQLHAYLQGVGIELMANSDNVLRGGLTPKHIDVAELLSILDFKGAEAEKVQIESSAAGEEFYLTPAAEFRLSRISVEEGQEYLSSRERSIEIIICTRGSASVWDLSTGTGFPVKKGDSFIIPASVEEYRITGSAHLYKAAVAV
ncbi:MAG: mannose-6-phosphate isomerase, class I [Spirochaeta sp.]|nr:mannose-6-phosphate isomerase, class I [Spirochaeta sp.]